MRDILLNNQISEIMGFFELPDSLRKQSEVVTQIKKSGALGYFLLGIFLIVGGAIGTISSIANFSKLLTDPMFIFKITGGPIILGNGVLMALLSILKAKKASQWTFATDLEILCRTFYSNAFCRKTIGFESKDDHIKDVCQFIPVPILKNYEKSGWDILIGKSKPRPEAQPIECKKCQKKSAHSEPTSISVPVPTKYNEEKRNLEPEETKILIKNLYLKCLSCGSVFCYECVAYSIPKTQRFLCQVCYKATNGWKGLSIRWMNLRYMNTDKEEDFSLHSLEIEKLPSSDQRIANMRIRLRGSPFGTLTLCNVAINIDKYWFLLTPEPIIDY